MPAQLTYDSDIKRINEWVKRETERYEAIEKGINERVKREIKSREAIEKRYDNYVLLTLIRAIRYTYNKLESYNLYCPIYKVVGKCRVYIYFGFDLSIIEKTQKTVRNFTRLMYTVIHHDKIVLFIKNVCKSELDMQHIDDYLQDIERISHYTDI